MSRMSSAPIRPQPGNLLDGNLLDPQFFIGRRRTTTWGMSRRWRYPALQCIWARRRRIWEAAS